jgi:ketosteroid isomerase-like protein
MNQKNPMTTALQFNECINNQDVEGLLYLMTENHTFIDRDEKVHQTKEFMIKCWKEFSQMFPAYKNNFTRIELNGDMVVIAGYAYWNEENTFDPAIWSARIENDLVAEWKIYYDNADNRARFFGG